MLDLGHIPALGEAEHRAGSLGFRARPAGLLCIQADQPSAALIEALGLPLPEQPNRAAGNGPWCLWTGPGEWRVVVEPEQEEPMAARLADAAAGSLAAITPIGDAYSLIEIEGPGARDLLSKGCGLDFHPGAFKAGHCARTRFAQTAALIHRVNDQPLYHLHVERPVARYIWSWLISMTSG